MELWYLRSSLLTTNRFNAYVGGWFVIFSKSFRNCKNWHSVPFFFVSEVKEWTDQTATSQPTNQPEMQCNASTYLHAYNTIRQWMETSSSPHSLRNWIVMLFPSNFLLAKLFSSPLLSNFTMNVVDSTLCLVFIHSVHHYYYWILPLVVQVNISLWSP